MNRYVERQDDGTVDWSKEGFELLNGFQQTVASQGDLACRKVLSEVLESRGFEWALPYEEYVLSDGAGKSVWVLMGVESLQVVRDGVIYNGAMHYELGSDELCDLWEMIRKAWNA